MAPLDAPADPATEQEVLRLTGEWPRILVEKDMAGLDRLLASDVLFVEGDGEVYDRARYAARVRDAAPCARSTTRTAGFRPTERRPCSPAARS